MNPRWRTMEQTSVLFTKGPWSLSDSTVRTVSVHWVLLFSYYFTTPAAGPGASGATHKALTSRAERLSTECFRRTAASQLRCSTSTSSSRVAVKRCLAALESWRSALELIGPVSLAVAWRGGGDWDSVHSGCRSEVCCTITNSLRDPWRCTDRSYCSRNMVMEAAQLLKYWRFSLFQGAFPHAFIKRYVAKNVASCDVRDHVINRRQLKMAHSDWMEDKTKYFCLFWQQ